MTKIENKRTITLMFDDVNQQDAYISENQFTTNLFIS